ncbi:MAG: TIGR00282 family metallophosphoesterase [Candidatus Omnitrophota bacterium]
MNILCIGDIVGRPGREAIKKLLPELIKELTLDLVVANAENSAGGSGITPRIADELFAIGCDVLTLGDHAWDRPELSDYLKENDRIIRPANFPEDTTPGHGWCMAQTRQGQKVGIINLLGRVFIRYNVNCPFRALEKITKELKQTTPILIADFHAEATSEKIALGHFIDGQISALVGSHTHVATADEKILPKGTAYITDLGMTGPHDSVIGQNKEQIIKRFITCMPSRFEVATDDVQLNGVIIEIDEKTGKAKTISRIQRSIEGANYGKPS